MYYIEKEKIKKEIIDDIESLKEFNNVEHYIETYFQQFLRNNEYDDNSIDLSYNYNMLKEIEADERFLSKLNFILSKYM